MEGVLSGTPRYRFRTSVELFPSRDGDWYLLRGGTRPALRVRAPAGADRRILLALAGEGLTAPDGSDAAERIRPLLAARLIVVDGEPTALPARLAERFSRQLPWLAESGDAATQQRRLRGAHVVILGCGGLGTWALGAVASLGVGRFTLVDHDTVELSNLNRQILYGVGDVGQAKVDCAARWLRSFDPDVEVRAVRDRVESAVDAADVAREADVLLLAADWPPYELGRWVNAACVAEQVPFLVAGQQPPVLKVGPTYCPGAGPCFACHERALAAAYPHYEELAEHRRRHPIQATTLGPASGVVATLLALDVLALLTGAHPPATRGRAMLLDMRTLEQRWELVARDPDCAVCGHLR